MVKWFLSYAIPWPTIPTTQSRRSSTVLLGAFNATVRDDKSVCMWHNWPCFSRPTKRQWPSPTWTMMIPWPCHRKHLLSKQKPSTSTLGLVMTAAQRKWLTTSVCRNAEYHRWRSAELTDQQSSKTQTTDLCLLKSISTFKHNDQKEGQLLHILVNSRSQTLAKNIVLRYQIASSSLAHLAAVKTPGSILNRTRAKQHNWCLAGEVFQRNLGKQKKQKKKERWRLKSKDGGQDSLGTWSLIGDLKEYQSLIYWDQTQFVPRKPDEIEWNWMNWWFWWNWMKLKYSGPIMLSTVWQTEIIPEDWRKGVIILLWKRKGSRNDYYVG